MRFPILAAVLAIAALWGTTAWLLSEPIGAARSQQSVPTPDVVESLPRNSSVEAGKLESPTRQLQPAAQQALPSGQVAIDVFATGGAEQVLVYPALPAQPRQNVEDEDRR